MRVHSDAAEQSKSGRRSALRLLDIERADEIFPVLLEEIVALGHPRALIAKVNFETSEIAPVVSLNCSKAVLQRFQTTLFSMENPLTRVLHTLQPELVPARGKRGPDYYYYPMVYPQSDGLLGGGARPRWNLYRCQNLSFAAETPVAAAGV